MRVRILGVLCVLGLMLGVAPLARAQSMKLLAPGVGWSRAGSNRLLWTSDDGHHWKDITPPSSNSDLISTVFFLNPQHGWVLLKYGEPDVPGGLRFDLATTDDGGANWSSSPLPLPQFSSPPLFNGAASIAFSDAEHGLLGLGTGVGAITRGHGFLMATGDGGKSWKGASGGFVGPMALITPQFGWVVSGQASNELYVTRDGARSWQRVVLPSPIKSTLIEKYQEKDQRFRQSFDAGLPPKVAAWHESQEEAPDYTYSTYSLPVFNDPKHGSLCVTYPDLVALFRTSDGGLTWKADRALTGLPQHGYGMVAKSAVADSTWITASVPRSGTPALVKLAPGVTSSWTLPDLSRLDLSGMSFADANHGWVLTGEGRLLSTTDGGASWNYITPPSSGGR